MRMDRYSDEVVSVETKTRTNKNQELYTDVYMNNVCVDIDNLKNVMKEDDYQPTEKLKLVKENKLTDVTYTDKEYNINILIEEAIKNQKQDNVKRSIDTKLDDMEIDNLIESINENRENKENKNNQNASLLADLMPGNDNTLVIPPYESSTLNSDNDSKSLVNLPVDNTDDKEKKEIQEVKNEVIKEEVKDKNIEDDELESNNEKDFEDDQIIENINNKKHGKVILIVFLILIIILALIGILLYKHII